MPANGAPPPPPLLEHRAVTDIRRFGLVAPHDGQTRSDSSDSRMISSSKM